MGAHEAKVIDFIQAKRRLRPDPQPHTPSPLVNLVPLEERRQACDLLSEHWPYETTPAETTLGPDLGFSILWTNLVPEDNADRAQLIETFSNQPEIRRYIGQCLCEVGEQSLQLGRAAANCAFLLGLERLSFAL